MHDILFALLSVLACLLQLGHGCDAPVKGLEVLEPGDLCLDESPLEVGVDDAGGLGGLGSLEHRPGLDLLVSGSEKVDEVETLVPDLDDPGEDALGLVLGSGESNLGGLLGALVEEGFLLVGVIPESPELLLELDGKGDADASAMALDPV